jgi:hypothetical protein
LLPPANLQKRNFIFFLLLPAERLQVPSVTLQFIRRCSISLQVVTIQKFPAALKTC